VTGLSDAERDACDVVQALVGLAALLRRPAEDLSGSFLSDLVSPDPVSRDPLSRDPASDEARRLLIGIAEDGGAAATRVLAYLRDLRGAGDGEAVAVPPRLGQWRDWVPPRGHVFGTPGIPRANEVPQPRRSDPGE
jgi:hypothetical protein